jgi:hypothetical protein
MDPIDNQRQIFSINAVLMLISALLLAAVIPAILMDTSPGSLPFQAASGALIGMGIHLFLAYWFGRRLKRRKSKIRKAVLIFSALGFFFLGFIIMDGAFAFQDDVLFAFFGMFVCSFIDLVAALVSFTGIFLLKTKKKP